MVFPASSALHFNVSKLLQYFVFHPIWDSSVSLGINAKMYQITNTMEKANVTQFLMNVLVSIEGFFQLSYVAGGKQWVVLKPGGAFSLTQRIQQFD